MLKIVLEGAKLPDHAAGRKWGSEVRCSLKRLQLTG
jgi:hypothetical protein